jgi:hypothetical protein
MVHHRRRRVPVASLTALMVLALAGSARGQTPPAFSLTVSPARLVVPVGQSEKEQIFDVSNSGSESIHVEVSVAEFSQRPNGQLAFAPATPLSAANWVLAGPLSFDLDPQEHQPVRVSISLPPEPEPGERYVAVVFKVPPVAAGRNILVSRAIGAQLLIGVPGRAIHRIGLGPLDAPWWADGGPIRFKVGVTNLGNFHRDFIHPDNLVALVGGEQSIDLPDFTVLGSSKRIIDAQWTNPPLFCICKIRVDSDDGQGGRVHAEATIIILPLRLFLGLLLAAVGLFLLTRRSRREQQRRRDELMRHEAATRKHFEDVFRSAESSREARVD